MIPVSIVTGFLGSGKTTLINRLLQDRTMKNTLVIINEFGEIALDHLLVSADDERVRLLSSGCLCCELRGDLVDTLLEISAGRARGTVPNFDRVLVETTGLADPVSIVQTVVGHETLSALYRLDTVVCVADAVHVPLQLETQVEAVKQLALSDVVVVSKGDVAGEVRVAAASEAVRHVNRGAKLFVAVHGNVDASELFGGTTRISNSAVLLERWLSFAPDATASETAQRHAPDVRTYSLSFDGTASAAGLATWLTMLGRFLGPAFLRMKGIINVDGTPYVVHAVQTVVHEPVELAAWPSEDRRTRVVFIVRGLERAALESTFTALGMPASLGAHGLHVHPAAYARFVRTAHRLL